MADHLLFLFHPGFYHFDFNFLFNGDCIFRVFYQFQHPHFGAKSDADGI